MKRITSLILILILLCLAFGGCKKKTATGKAFAYPISSKVTSLDPQIAKEEGAMAVLSHAMEGLTRLNEQGEVAAGVAKTWEISPDGRTYTFYLRNDAKWHLNKKAKELATDTFDDRVTANDFVFALQRAADPNTNAPLFYTVSAIKNAEKIHNGSATAANLGVKALDDWTLRITLDRPDSALLKTVSTPITYPCNKTFFELTKGRYALETQFFISNGPFYVSVWDDETLGLPVSDSYMGDKAPVPGRLTFKTNKDPIDIAAKIKDGTYDAANLPEVQANDLQKQDGISLIPCQDIVWSFLLNTNDAVLANENLRAALSLAFSRDIAGFPSGMSKASGIVPGIGNVSGTVYRTAAGSAGIFATNGIKAQSYWEKGLKELKEDSLSLTVLCAPAQETFVKQLLQTVQGNIGLSLSLKIQVVSEGELQHALAAGTYQIAFASIKADTESVYDFLTQFTSSSKNNPVRMKNKTFDQALQHALAAPTKEEQIKKYKEAESILLNAHCIYPVSFAASSYVTAKNVSRVNFYNHGGKVNFIFAERKD